MSESATAALEARLAALEANAAEQAARIRKAEDQLALYQLMCGYGYAVDGLNRDFIREIYAPDGVYDIPGMLKFVGADEVSSMTERATHRSYVKAGSAHTVPLPYVVIEGDRATGTSYHIVIVKGIHGGDHHQIYRASACRWDFSRKADGGWQVDYRKNIFLDGSPEGSALLGRLNEGPGVVGE